MRYAVRFNNAQGNFEQKIFSSEIEAIAFQAVLPYTSWIVPLDPPDLHSGTSMLIPGVGWATFTGD